MLNQLSTGAMIRLGKVYGNLMVDVKATNAKLRQRCINIVREATGVDAETAAQALSRCGGRCKTAIVMLLWGVSPDEAEAMLARADGRVAAALR